MQPSALVDISWQGQPRKLLVHANRNGYFYVLDRTNGSRRRVERQSAVELPDQPALEASPMTYMFDNKQYVAIAAGPNIMAFGLPE